LLEETSDKFVATSSCFVFPVDADLKHGELRVSPSRATRAAWTPSQAARRRKEQTMLRIYTTIIHLLHDLRPIISQIEVHDRDLARQLRRAAASVALNTSEGSGAESAIATRWAQRARQALASTLRWRWATSTRSTRSCPTCSITSAQRS
jgi:hypothetical protein